MGARTRRLALIAWLCLVPRLVFAQASITGTVKDASGAVLPGATVEASSDVLIEKVRSVTTDSTGQYRIVDLRPGVYTVTCTLPGFGKFTREGVELTGSFTATINAELKVGSLEESVTVTGESPVVDVQNTRRETVLSADVIASLPGTRAYGSLLNATPGLTVDNNGLAATPTMTFFTAHGGNTNEGRMTINGMTVAAAFNGGGVSSLTYDTINAEEVSVLVSGGLGENETGGPAMNIVPRTGSNKFSGQAFFNGAGKWSTGDNLDDELRAIGITRGPGIIGAYDFSGSYGGPIKQDRLWFWGSYRKFSTAQGVEGIGANRYAGDPAQWGYLRDDSIEPRNVQGRDILSVRFTGQVTPRNKVTFSQENQYRCEGSTLTTSGKGCRQREGNWIALGSTTMSPEANTGYFDFPYWVTQATWTSPVTSKLLLESGFTRFAYRHAGGPGQLPPDGIFDLIPVTEQQAIDNHRANFVYRGLSDYLDNYGNPNNWRASLSYVTGAHNMKIGYQGAYLIADTTRVANDSQLAYRFTNQQPNAFSYRLQNFQQADRTGTAALFVQDTWTHNRLTLQGALRYDRVWSFSPAEHNGTTTISRFNAAAITPGETKGVDAYNDISPRVGIVYDVFGTGKTAVKFNLGRYLAPGTNDTIYTMNNQAAAAFVYSVTNRGWSDTNGNKVVDCDINNPAQQVVPGGDTCGALTGSQLNFGKPGIATRVNPDLLKGWGVRPVDWQYGIDVQHELAPRVSLDVAYNRRWWGNFIVTDNVSVGPSDYEKWVYTAPKDSRLPGGGGYPIPVYTLTAAAAARPADNYVTFETDFGSARTRYWHGVDVTLNARLRNNLFLQGGTATGRQVQDTCDSVLKVDSPDARFCHDVEPFQTALRGSATYTVPRVGVLVSATVRSQPSLFRDGVTPPGVFNTGSIRTGTNPSGANVQVPNTVVQSLLGRLPPGGLANGTTTVALLDNDEHRMYADNRRTQVDMRFAKVVRFNGRRADIGVDLYNLLNANYVNQATGYENQYDFVAPNGGTWNNPITILPPRFVRFNVTFNF
jgi:hypothetical protein